MKTLHTVTSPTQYPAFWTEEWLQIAINELDRLNLSPEELLVYEMTLSANALAVRNEERKIREAEERAELRARMQAKKEAISRGLFAGLPVELIAELNGVSVESVREMQRQQDDNSSTE
jgi:predicted transposase YdaD